VKNLSGLSYSDIAFEVCSAFERVGVTAVLSGGGAATIYAPEAYESRDLDFIFQAQLWLPNADPVLALGFAESSTRGTFAHPDIPFTLEFLKGPLAVGDEVIQTWNTFHKGELTLHVISPTDVVKDRLASVIHYRDHSAIRQAAAVAQSVQVELDSIRAWCENEGGADVFAIFQKFREE
jgi:hypothetical protein